jgi:preprotein translocase subunit SecD
MMGAQPASVARQSVITQDILSSQAIQRREENEIVEQWAVGIAEGNTKEIESARAKMIAWNAANPEYRVVITSNQLRDRIKQLKLPQDVRLIKSAPKEMRREAVEELRR